MPRLEKLSDYVFQQRHFVEDPTWTTYTALDGS